MVDEQQGELILAITGASGSLVGLRLLEVLADTGWVVHLIVSPGAERVLESETGLGLPDLKALATVFHECHDLAAPLSSGSYIAPHVTAMLIAPCSMKTLAAIALGISDNLITRAADVVLKERKRLVLVPRESPLNAIHLENMLRLSRMGVTIAPPIPPFYQKPRTIDELLNQTIGRILDQVEIHTTLTKRWRET